MANTKVSKTEELFLAFVLGAASQMGFGFGATLREEIARLGFRAMLRDEGMGGLGRDDWNDLARWFLNRNRVWLWY